MNEHDAMHAAVCADPGNDLPRLVYADWCEENGRPERARFIRAQIEAERYVEADPRRDELKQLAGRLRRGHTKAWGGGLTPSLREHFGPFRRGFVSDLIVTQPHKAAGIAARASGLVPIDGAVLHIRPRGRYRQHPTGTTGAANTEWLRRLRRVEFRDLRAIGDVRSWLGHDDLRPPEDCSLYHCPTLADNVTLLSHAKLTQIGRLSVSVEFGRVDFDAFAAEDGYAPRFPNMTDFSLTTMDWVSVDLTNLPRVPWLASLRTLSLAVPHTAAPGSVGELAGVEMPYLRTLAYSGAGMTFTALRRLLDSAAMPAMRELILPDCDLGPRAAAALAKSPLFSRLETLDLSHNRVGDAAAEALAEARPAGMARLALKHNPVSNEVKRRLRQRGVVI